LKKNEDLSARAYRSNFIFNSKCTWTIILLWWTALVLF
jgi:hypothetical protein